MISVNQITQPANIPAAAIMIGTLFEQTAAVKQISAPTEAK
jgi:hypothetical protein